MLKSPPHPGQFVRMEIIEAHGLSVTAAALHLGVARTSLTTFLNHKSPLSASLALRLEKAFGIKSETLMRMQSAYDIAKVRETEMSIDIQPFSVYA
jgi:antitoxin HigA-1